MDMLTFSLQVPPKKPVLEIFKEDTQIPELFINQSHFKLLVSAVSYPNSRPIYTQEDDDEQGHWEDASMMSKFYIGRQLLTDFKF